MALVTAAVAMVYFSMLMTQDKDEASDAKRGNLKNKKKPRIPLTTYIKWYKRFHNNILFRSEFSKIEKRIGALAVYTPQECRIVSTQFYGVSLIVSLGVFLVFAILYRDIFVTLLIVLYAQIIKDTLIFNQMDKVQFQVLHDLKMAFSSVREKYQMKQDIPSAIYDAEKSNLLKTSFDDIFNILTDEDGEVLLEVMFATNPYRLVQTFAGICYQLNESGDTVLPDGSLNFHNAIFKLNEEVNLEILKTTKAKAVFKGLSVLPVIPVLFLSFLQSIMTSNIPGLAYLYLGTYGYIARITIILSSILCYKVISKMNAITPIAKDDRWEISKYMLSKTWFAKFIFNIKPIEGARKKAKTKEIKKAMSVKNMDHLYSDKVIATVLIFVCTFVVSAIGIITGRNYIYNTYTYNSMTSSEVIDAKETAKRQGIDAQFLENKSLPTSEETLAFLQKYYPNLDEYAIQDQMVRITSKYTNYHNTIYYWWILGIIFLLSYGGWLLPDLFLIRRKKAVREESLEDTMQLQTMISILMNTRANTLDTLYWLEKQSIIHKDALSVAYQNYVSDPDMSLEILRRSDPNNADFVRLCNKLKLTAYQISLKDAFSDVEADRAYMLQMREISNSELIASRHSRAVLLALIPIILMTILSLVVPMAVVSMTQFSGSMAESQNISESSN